MTPILTLTKAQLRDTFDELLTLAAAEGEVYINVRGSSPIAIRRVRTDPRDPTTTRWTLRLLLPS